MEPPREFDQQARERLHNTLDQEHQMLLHLNARAAHALVDEVIEKHNVAVSQGSKPSTLLTADFVEAAQERFKEYVVGAAPERRHVGLTDQDVEVINPASQELFSALCGRIVVGRSQRPTLQALRCILVQTASNEAHRVGTLMGSLRIVQENSELSKNLCTSLLETARVEESQGRNSELDALMYLVPDWQLDSTPTLATEVLATLQRVGEESLPPAVRALLTRHNAKALYAAAVEGDTARVAELVAAQADPNFYDSQVRPRGPWTDGWQTGATALIKAVQQGHVQVVQTLLSYERVDRGLLDEHGRGRSARFYAKKNPVMNSLF